MSGKSRLDRLSPDLSARERAILSVQALRAGREPEWSVHWTMPDDQVTEYNELITMANGVYRVLLPHALRLEAEAQVVKRELGMLSLLVVWGAERRILAEPTLMALDGAGKRLSKPLSQARERLRELYETDRAPHAPEVLLPVLAERLGLESASEIELTPMDRQVVALAKHLQTQIPLLRSWLVTVEQAVADVVQALDESAIPPPLEALLASTHDLIDGPDGADLYLGTISGGEIDESLAAGLAAKLKNN